MGKSPSEVVNASSNKMISSACDDSSIVYKIIFIFYLKLKADYLFSFV